MNTRRGKGGGGRRPPVEVVPGAREAIERAWFAAVMSDADPQRIAQLERMLRPAANDAYEAKVVPSGEPANPK